MKLFSSLYDKVLEWSRHRHAERYLAAVSFAESSFFPVPTVLMMAPMALARREHAWRLALLTTVTSVAGGVLGYFIGLWFFDSVGQPILEFYHAEEKFAQLKSWFDQWGVWVVFLAGVTPIPYKVFTIGSGLVGLALLPFILASLVGRAVQFYIAAAIAVFGGETLEDGLRKWLDWIGWGILGVGALAYLLLR